MQNQEQNWMPLQSNPQVVNPFIAKMGLKTNLYSFQEMLSIDDWALDMIPRPVLGVMMLYQITPVQKEFTNTEAGTLDPTVVPADMFYMKQFAQNACGTIALFHIVLNALKRYPNIIEQNCYLHKFLSTSKNSNPEQKGKAFQQAQQIKQQHKGASQQGQSAVQSDCDSHFIAFIEFDGYLWELDGLKKCPIRHGPCSVEEVLGKSSEQIRKYMDRDPDNISFCMLTLANAQPQAQE